MEERIIDDEYGRGIRLKKTKDGYVDVTDELCEEGEEGMEEVDEVAFEFPVFEDEDDEELATMTPQEAVVYRQQKAENEKNRQEEYDALCAEGDEFLQSGSYHSAELKYEKAMQLDKIATRATVGYWTAKTSNFTDPDQLLEDYIDEGMDALEHDLGLQAVEILKRKNQAVFQTRLDDLKTEEKPLTDAYQEKQSARKEIINARLKKSAIASICCLVPTLALLVLAIVFGLKNFSTRGNDYLTTSLVFAGAFVVMLLVTSLVCNKCINDLRMRRQNNRLSSTEEGKKLADNLAMQALYEGLLQVSPVESVDEEPMQNTENQESAQTL